MKRFYLLLAMMLTMLGYTNMAHAFDLFAPPETDWLMKNIMTPMFDPEQSPFGKVSEVFLAGVLTFGGILAGYTMLVGTMNTAHDGEALGKRWSTLWVPIRTTLGVAMILPIKSGFCAIQIIIVWLATQGIGIADQAWNAFAADPLRGSVYGAPVIKPKLATAYKQIVINSACITAAQQSYQQMKNDGSIVAGLAQYFGGKEPKFGVVPTSNVIGYKFGDSNHEILDRMCGSVAINPPEKVDTSVDFSSANGASNWITKANQSLIDINQIRGVLYNENAKLSAEFMQSAIKQGQKIATDTSYSPKELAVEMKSAIDTYTTALTAAANSQFSSAVNKNAITSMQEDGFVSAGAWFMRIMKAQDTVNEEFNNVPTAAQPTTTWSVSDFMIKWIATDVKATMIKAQNMGNMAYALTKSGIQTDAAQDTVGFEGFITETFVNSGALFSMDNFKTDSNPDRNLDHMNQNPISAAMGIGNRIVAGVAGAWIVIGSIFAAGSLAGGSIIGKIVGADSFVGTMASMSAPILAVITFTILVPALFLSTYLPLMPFIIWTGTVIGWLVLVVEALFAGPLWAVAHLAPDADSVVGKQGQGYMLILSLVLRPILMVIGFVVAMSLMVPAGMFVNYFFTFAVSGSGSNVLSQLFISIASCFIYCVILNNIIKKLLSIIHSLPDAILQWIGGGGSQILGQYGGGIESESNAGTTGAIRTTGDVGSRLGQSIKDVRGQRYGRSDVGKERAAEAEADKQRRVQRHLNGQ